MIQQNGDSSSEESDGIVYGDVEMTTVVDLRHLLPKDTEGKTPKNMEEQIDEMSFTSVDSHEDDGVADNNKKCTYGRQNDAYATPPSKLDFWMQGRRGEYRVRNGECLGTEPTRCDVVRRSVYQAKHIERKDVLQRTDTDRSNDGYASIHQQLLWEVSCIARSEFILYPSYLIPLFIMLSKKQGQRTKNYEFSQKGINPRMRKILFDWLSNIRYEYNLYNKTLHHSVRIFDMYCGRMKVKQCVLQLVGVTSMILASKYEEESPPKIRDFVELTDGACSAKDAVTTELDILKTLGWTIAMPTCYTFMHQFLEMIDTTAPIRECAEIYLECSIFCITLLDYPQSIVAASTLILAVMNPNSPAKNRSTLEPVVRVCVKY